MRTFESFSTTAGSSLSPAKRAGSSAETYAEPENFLEIEVVDAVTHMPRGDGRSGGNGSGSGGMFTDYLVVCHTNLPSFGKRVSRVRRRYSDFEFFRRCLVQELALMSHPRVAVPGLPGKILLSNRFNEEVVEERRAGLDAWLRAVAGHPLLQLGSKALVRFVEEETFAG